MSGCPQPHGVCKWVHGPQPRGKCQGVLNHMVFASGFMVLNHIVLSVGPSCDKYRQVLCVQPHSIVFNHRCQKVLGLQPYCKCLGVLVLNHVVSFSRSSVLKKCHQVCDVPKSIFLLTCLICNKYSAKSNLLSILWNTLACLGNVLGLL